MTVACVVVVGASGTGKSTLVRAVKAAGLPVEIPPRFVTRPPRDGDVDGENVFLGPDAFEAQAGQMAVHWSRVLAPGRVERYGFPRTAPGRLPLYSANNAWPRDAVPGALLVGIVAPEPVRLARLQQRSAAQWQKAPDELAQRMADPAAAVEAWVDVVISNHGPHEATAAEALIRVVRDALRG